jgi:hypothetical protein
MISAPLVNTKKAIFQILTKTSAKPLFAMLTADLARLPVLAVFWHTLGTIMVKKAQ